MINKMKKRSLELWIQLRGLLKRLAQQLLNLLKKAWAEHRDRVNSNPSYTAALGAAVGAVLELFTHDPALLAVAAALVALYVAIHRATSPHPWQPTDPWQPRNPWDDDQPWQ